MLRKVSFSVRFCGFSNFFTVMVFQIFTLFRLSKISRFQKPNCFKSMTKMSQNGCSFCHFQLHHSFCQTCDTLLLTKTKNHVFSGQVQPKTGDDHLHACEQQPERRCALLFRIPNRRRSLPDHGSKPTLRDSYGVRESGRGRGCTGYPATGFLGTCSVCDCGGGECRMFCVVYVGDARDERQGFAGYGGGFGPYFWEMRDFWWETGVGNVIRGYVMSRTFCFYHEIRNQGSSGSQFTVLQVLYFYPL